MKPLKAIAGITSVSAMVFGGVDASKLNETPIERIEQIGEERVEAKQIGNVVEATLPWKDQESIKVKYDMGEPSLTEKIKDKRNKEVITEVVTDFDGGFKVDILLNEKPDTNRFCYAIEGAENYDFFYQPPLTQEEKDQGAHRPPEIEGSYAVYHKTKRDHVTGKENYATGKVMHIPRPQVWELANESEKVWADLSYDSGQLCVTVPQDFLNGAKYPVRVDPTFGYITSGGTSQTRVSGSAAPIALLDAQYRASTGDTVTSLVANTRCANAAGTAQGLQLGIYDTSATNTPLTRQVTQNIHPTTTSQSWIASSTNLSMVSGTTYTVAAGNTGFGSCDATGVTMYYDVAASSTDQHGLTFGLLPATWSTFTDLDRIYSMYAVYTNGTNTPQVVTLPSKNSGPEFGNVFGSITFDFGNEIDAYGFVYGTSPSLSGGDTATTTLAAPGVIGTLSFSTTISGLNRNTTYYFKAFATNNNGSGFGDTLSFTTTHQNTIRINNGTTRINNGTIDI